MVNGMRNITAPRAVSLLLAAAGAALFPTAHAAPGDRLEAKVDNRLQQRANGILSLMAYSVVPDLTTSSLSIQEAETGNPGITMSQLGGGFTVSKSLPLYLEGAIAYSRYDPEFVVTQGAETRVVPVKWNTVSATGGIGWDFPIADELVLRPIANFALGYMASDASLANWFVGQRTGYELDFLNDGNLAAAGWGGSLMLDYEHYRPGYEIDVELRYTYIRLESIGGSEAVKGHADAKTANLWARWRAPTGFTALDRPLRYVLEVSHSQFLGSQAGILGFDSLSTLGVGLELDSSKYDIFVTRWRLVARHVMGDNVSGMSLGFAVSF
ncbi:hypothetical protein FAZ21_15115 [Chitiniphilus eburneus]|uniref:Autotransporter outer membrane beta-barrel domain-containing protein n=2 Tax=Chitiniphilus eburneus TaxID=2571148 RepID=A0A4V5MPK2_9NEIS|nr:hypothetical protein FAZ21_15115 [Chitiniphilus eburneus]